MPDVKKIAALAMLEVDVEEAATLCADVAAILDMGKTLPAEEDIPLPRRSVPTAALRADDAAPKDGRGVALLALSKKEQDGYLTVSRTVGGNT